MDPGEKVKYQRFLKEYNIFKKDIVYTYQVLLKLKEEKVQDALMWIKINFDRMGGFKTDNGY
jgi:energy-converting hydrogenase A subunit M